MGFSRTPCNNTIFLVLSFFDFRLTFFRELGGNSDFLKKKKNRYFHPKPRSLSGGGGYPSHCCFFMFLCHLLFINLRIFESLYFISIRQIDIVPPLGPESPVWDCWIKKRKFRLTVRFIIPCRFTVYTYMGNR